MSAMGGKRTLAGLLINGEVRVPSNLPQVAIRIGEIARIPTPKYLLPRFHNPSAYGRYMGEELINFCRRLEVVRQRNSRKCVRAVVCNGGIFGERRTRVESETDALQLEEGDALPIVQHGQP